MKEKPKFPLYLQLKVFKEGVLLVVVVYRPDDLNMNSIYDIRDLGEGFCYFILQLSADLDPFIDRRKLGESRCRQLLPVLASGWLDAG